MLSTKNMREKKFKACKWNRDKRGMQNPLCKQREAHKLID